MSNEDFLLYLPKVKTLYSYNHLLHSYNFVFAIIYCIGQKNSLWFLTVKNKQKYWFYTEDCTNVGAAGACLPSGRLEAGWGRKQGTDGGSRWIASGFLLGQSEIAEVEPGWAIWMCPDKKWDGLPRWKDLSRNASRSFLYKGVVCIVKIGKLQRVYPKGILWVREERI